MTKKIYRDKGRDLGVLLNDVETWFGEQGYQTQTNKADNTWLLQATKTEGWRKAVGASRAFNVLIQGQPNDFSVELSTGEWASNLTAGGVAAVLTGGASIIATGIATAWSKKVEGDLWGFIEQKVLFGEKAKSTSEMAALNAQNALNDKFKQLQIAFDQGLIDEVAYNAKKLEIEGQVRATKQDAVVEEKLMKLKNLLDSGILSQTEFEMKKAELMRESSSTELDAQISKLNAALAAGILTQEEYEQKKKILEKESTASSRLRQLENARDTGIITRDEFEKKKLELLV
ncbi:MAG: SHOCT domain-containing protein [Leptolyngbyaceae cyanobacterium bins.302]|nr:SHOCT domain-containing protein [Leptolyngbyaceae cyanobacterium bins.302]